MSITAAIRAWFRREHPLPKPAGSVFDGRGLFVTRDDPTDRAQLAAHAKASGFEWLAFQWGDPHWGDAYAACGKQGLRRLVWDEAPAADRVLALGDCDGYIAQAEGTSFGPLGALRALHGWKPRLPLAIVTNLNPSRTDSTFDPAMHALDVACLVECYLPENRNAQPDGMIREAIWRGYHTVVPVFGVYHRYPLEAYQPHLYPRFAVWCAETMLTPTDWEAVR